MKNIKATFEHNAKAKPIPWARLPQVSGNLNLVISQQGNTKPIACLSVTFYESPRGNTVHCVVNVRDPDGDRVAGYGKAGGYGYHKESAALGEALRDAGFTFTEKGQNFRIDGTGNTWYEETLVAAIKAYGWDEIEFGHTLV